MDTERRATISLSEESLPNAMRVEIKTAMGTASASIHARLRKTNSNIKENSNPFPKNLSILRSRKLANNTNNRASNAIIKG